MKVFEVISEYSIGDSNEIIKEVQYVTSDKDTLKSVVDHFTRSTYEEDKQLIGVKEVIAIVQHIKDNTGKV